MSKVLLTKDFISSAACPAGMAKITYFDTGCRGLVLDVRPSGSRVFGLRYVDHRKVQRQQKIGHADDLRLEQARQLADKLRNQIAMGIDPKREANAAKKCPTLSSFVLDQYIPYVKGYKRSWAGDLAMYKNHIERHWGHKHLDEITKADLITLLSKHQTTHAPGSCNRLLILLRYMFNLALKWETPGIAKNPTAGYPLLKEDNHMSRYLTTEEAQRLYGCLLKSANPMLRYIVPMLIVTGARKREVLDARWEDFDLERRSWRIHTTKLGMARHVPLSDGAISVLQSVLRIDGCPWVFANPKTQKPYVSIYCAWDTARKAVGLADVRMHDLRHSFASFLVNAGRTLYEVQHLLGHTQIKTTQRYSHLSQHTLLDASNAATRALGAVMLPLAPVKSVATIAVAPALMSA